MKTSKFVTMCTAVGAIALLAAPAEAARYDTLNTAGGADLELRESQPTTNRGDNSEIASRIADGSRNSVIYLKFGVGDISLVELANEITIQTTYRNTNLSPGRIEDASGGPNTGFDYYVGDPLDAAADWGELTATPIANAPVGYVFDGNFATKATGTPSSPSPGLTYLGTKRFDSAQLVGSSPHMPVGGPFEITLPAGSPLHTAIATAQGTSHETVTVAMAIAHETDTTNSQWINFNYLFNPKEQDPLNDDADSPFGGAANDLGQFAPALITVPEPTSVVLIGLGGVALLVGQRRRN